MAGVRQVGRPERGKAVKQMPGVLRRADLQHEQGDRNGDDRIAEKDDPARDFVLSRTLRRIRPGRRPERSLRMNGTSGSSWLLTSLAPRRGRTWKGL
jgi:hypothetical protein